MQTCSWPEFHQSPVSHLEIKLHSSKKVSHLLVHWLLQIYMLDGAICTSKKVGKVRLSLAFAGSISQPATILYFCVNNVRSQNQKQENDLYSTKVRFAVTHVY